MNTKNSIAIVAILITSWILSPVLMNHASAQGLKQAFAKKQEKTTITVDSGGYEFDVPAPADLVPLKKELKTLAGYMKKQAPGNQVHEIYAPKGSTEKSFINKGLYRNCDVQTIKALANQDLDAKSFKQVKTMFNQQFESLMKKVLSDMKDNTGLTIKTREKVGSGTLIDTDNQYAYLFYAQVADGMGSQRADGVAKQGNGSFRWSAGFMRRPQAQRSAGRGLRSFARRRRRCTRVKDRLQGGRAPAGSGPAPQRRPVAGRSCSQYSLR